MQVFPSKLLSSTCQKARSVVGLCSHPDTEVSFTCSSTFIRVEKKFSEVVEGMQEGIDAYHIFGGCTIPFNYVFSCD